MGPIEKLSLASLVSLGATPILWAFDDPEEVPDGVVIRDAREIIDASELFENPDRNTFAGFSNLFRYTLLSKRDDIWFDLDMLFAKIPDLSSSYLFGLQDNITVNGAVLGVPRNSTITSSMLQLCRKRIASGYSWGDLGPRLLTEHIHHFGLKKLASPVKDFYGVHYRETWKLFDPAHRAEVESVERQAIGIHLWNEVIRSGPISPREYVPAESYLDKKFRELGISVETRQVDPKLIAEWQRQLNPLSARLRDRLLENLPGMCQGVAFSLKAKRGAPQIRSIEPGR